MEKNKEQRSKLKLSQQTPSTLQKVQDQNNKYSIIIEYSATIVVFICAILPFLNNILGWFIDMDKTVPNNAGVGILTLDVATYYLSISLSLLLFAIASIFRPHIYSVYVAIISYYFHLVTYIRFIFFNKNEVSEIAIVSVFIVLILIIYIVYRLNDYYKSLREINEFNNKTLNRFSSLLYKHNNINEDDKL